MKRILIALLVLALATGAYLLCYRLGTRETRLMLGSSDDLVWLRQEFALNDEQASAIDKIQLEFEPRCMEMCNRIEQSSARLDKLLRENKGMNPEIEEAVREASRLQGECRTATLAQAFLISAHMAPEHAIRYRAMIAERVLPARLPPGTNHHH